MTVEQDQSLEDRAYLKIKEKPELLASAIENLSAKSLNHIFIGACRHGDTVLMQKLLEIEGEKRIDVHFQHDTALAEAISGGHYDAMVLLLDLEGDRRIVFGPVSNQFDILMLLECLFYFPSEPEESSLTIFRYLLTLTDDRYLNDEELEPRIEEIEHPEVKDAFLACLRNRSV